MKAAEAADGPDHAAATDFDVFMLMMKESRRSTTSRRREAQVFSRRYPHLRACSPADTGAYFAGVRCGHARRQARDPGVVVGAREKGDREARLRRRL